MCRGHAFLCIGEVEKAKNHLKKALSFDPDNPQASRLWKTAKMMDSLKQVP
jgi:Tfp pilus assembly protein PilF